MISSPMQSLECRLQTEVRTIRISYSPETNYVRIAKELSNYRIFKILLSISSFLYRTWPTSLPQNSGFPTGSPRSLYSLSRNNQNAKLRSIFAIAPIGRHNISIAARVSYSRNTGSCINLLFRTGQWGRFAKGLGEQGTPPANKVHVGFAMHPIRCG
jgi:hypothetical protein